MKVDDNAAYNLFDIWAVPADDPTGLKTGLCSNPKRTNV